MTLNDISCPYVTVGEGLGWGGGGGGAVGGLSEKYSHYSRDQVKFLAIWFKLNNDSLV